MAIGVVEIMALLLCALAVVGAGAAAVAMMARRGSGPDDPLR